MIAAYLFGVFSNVDSHAYVHLITAHKDYRRQGLARALYAHFTEKAKQHNMKYIKAITSVSNHESRKFHADIGIKLLGEATFDGILVVKDYAGPGQDRVVFLNFSNKIYKQYIGAYNT